MSIFVSLKLSNLVCFPLHRPAFPEGDPPPVWQLPWQADPQGLPGQIQPQEDEEVRLLITQLTTSETWAEPAQ